MLLVCLLSLMILSYRPSSVNYKVGYWVNLVMAVNNKIGVISLLIYWDNMCRV